MRRPQDAVMPGPGPQDAVMLGQPGPREAVMPGQQGPQDAVMPDPPGFVPAAPILDGDFFH